VKKYEKGKRRRLKCERTMKKRERERKKGVKQGQ
jgi:hypothetical protein